MEERIIAGAEETLDRSWGEKQEMSLVEQISESKPLILESLRHSKFLPESTVLHNNRLENPRFVSVNGSLEEVLQFASTESIFPSDKLQGNSKEEKLEQLLVSVSQKFPDRHFIFHLMYEAKQKGELAFGLMCLPCLNPNPFITDHPGIAINVATVIFLERLNHIAQKMEEVLEVGVTFRIARELEHMSGIFNLTESDIETGKSEINTLIRDKGLNHIRICSFPISDSESEPTAEDVEKFLPAFKRSQVIKNISPIAVMRWLGTINDKDATTSAERAGINLEHELKLIEPFEQNARIQATKWASIREFPWQTFGELKGSTVVSVRPGSKNFTIVPVSKDSSDVDRAGRKIPMLPQHCNVGIKPDRTLITTKRAQFLLQPQKWIEVETEFGSVFIHTSLL